MGGQSLDKLKACYAYSAVYTDFTARYAEGLFEDHAIIVWAPSYTNDGLVDMNIRRIAKSGFRLCPHRRILPDPAHGILRTLLPEVCKEDFAGVETISTYFLTFPQNQPGRSLTPPLP